MSNQYHSRSNKSCSFCHKPGHHIKHCQALANTECNNCGGTGHTTKHCKKPRCSQGRFQQDRFQQDRFQQDIPFRRRTDRRKVVTNQNGWSTIGRSNEEQKPKEWPQLVSTPTKVVTNQNGWANIARSKEEQKPKEWPQLVSTPTKVVKSKPVEAVPIVSAEPVEAVLVLTKVKIPVLPIFKKNFKKGARWADICDEDDEKNCPEELEQDVYYVFGK